MELEATITVRKNCADVEKLFRVELQHLQQERSGVTLTKKKQTLSFQIKAKDSIALRSTMNGITKLLTVYEKAQSLENE